MYSAAVMDQKAQLLIYIHTEGRVNSWRISLELIAVVGTVKAMFLDLGMLVFSCDIQRCVSDGHGHGKLSGKKDVYVRNARICHISPQ